MQNGDNPQTGTTTIPEPAPAPQTSPASSSPSTPSLWSSLDAIGRATATLVVVIYVFGFVILGFHDARYGVAQFSPFRARIMLDGLVFLILVSLAASAQHYGIAYLTWLEPVVKDRDPKRLAYREIVLAAGFIYTATVISSSLGVFLFRDSPSPTPKYNIWPSFQSMAIYFVGFSVLIVVGKIYLKRPKLSAFLALVAFGIILAGLFLRPGFANPSNYLLLVLALVGWLTTWVKRENSPIRYALDYRNWSFVILLVWLYISHVFAALPPRWGGGQPIPVQILQNTPAPWLGSNPADVLLLDETDQGLYVLLSPTGKAYFVPRANVASMFFGTKDELSKKP